MFFLVFRRFSCGLVPKKRFSMGCNFWTSSQLTNILCWVKKIYYARWWHKYIIYSSPFSKNIYYIFAPKIYYICKYLCKTIFQFAPKINLLCKTIERTLKTSSLHPYDIQIYQHRKFTKKKYISIDTSLHSSHVNVLKVIQRKYNAPKETIMHQSSSPYPIST